MSEVKPRERRNAPRILGAALTLAFIVAFFLLLPEPRAPQPDAWPEQDGNSFMLRGVTVFDGTGVRGRRDVLVQDGIITVVSPKAPLPEGVQEFAADGHTLLPAFFDAHTHNFGASRVDALRFGVGTQIDMFTDASTLATAREARESRERTDQADMWSAGTLVTAAGGHGTQFGVAIPTLDAATDAAAFIAERIAEGSDFIKLVREPGDVIGQPLPTLDPETLAAAVEAAHAQGKLAVVHVTTQADAVIAVEAGADGLVHIFGDSVIEPALVEAMRERGMFVIPTLAILESLSGRTSGLPDDPRIAPFLDPSQRDSLARPFPPSPDRANAIEHALESVRLLHAAGVPVLAGSDAPNPGTAHGASLHRELELLVQAGMTPAEALSAATAAVARHFGIDDRGRIERQLRADLALVKGDPTTEITTTRDIVAIWKNGFRVARVRFDGPVAATPALDDPSLGSFDDGVEGWAPTTDRIQGGVSEAVQAVENGALVVAGEVKSGSMYPWAGTIRMFGSTAFAPVDASAYATLELRVRGDGGPLSVLFFAGSGGQAPPVTHAITVGADWTTVTIALDELAGLDTGSLRAVAVVAGPAPRKFRFELDSAVLR